MPAKQCIIQELSAAEAETPTPGAPGPNDLRLRALAFVAGAVLMGLEILGSRVLAPEFGTGVMVWAALIGLFLLSMAGGAWLGGALADRRPSPALLHGLMLVAALLIAGTPAIGPGFCRRVAAAGVGPRLGPLIAASLFLAPSLLLGAATPFALRIAAPGVAALGRVAGRLSAVATIGGIVGTFGTAFALLPLLGVARSFLVLAATLAVLPLLWALTDRPSRAPLGVLLALVVGSGSLARAMPDLPREGARLVHEEDTPYHHIRVVESKDERILMFDRYEEAGVRLEPPHASSLAYTEGLLMGALAQHPAPERLLFLGGGVGVVARQALRLLPDARATLVDIDPAVLRLARERFFLEEDDRLTVVADDARRFLRTHPGPWDAVVIDVFTMGGRVPQHLVTRELFELLHSRLSPGGRATMNLVGSLEGPGSLLPAAVHRTASEVFANVGVEGGIPPGRARGGGTSPANITLVLSPTQVGRAPSREAPVGWRSAPILTDDWAPIDLLAEGSADASPVERHGDVALALVHKLTAFGPRFPGAPGHEQAARELARMLADAGAAVRTQVIELYGRPIQNIIGSFHPGATPRVILGTHWDTREHADKAEQAGMRESPVPGANDGSSGVAVLLAIAPKLRGLPVDIVLFDGEEPAPGRNEHFLGSMHFARELRDPGSYRAALVLDMVCRKQAPIEREPVANFHASWLYDKLFATAKRIAPDGPFQDRLGRRIQDDHTALLARRVPAVLLAGIDDPMWHTPFDLPERCDGPTLDAVSRVVLEVVRDLTANIGGE